MTAFKNVISCLNSVVQQHNISAKLGAFFYEPPGMLVEDRDFFKPTCIRRIRHVRGSSPSE